MFCKKCGEDVPDDSQFCPFCAVEIKRAKAPEPTPPPAATVPMQPQQPPAPPPQYAAAPAPAKSSGSGAMVWLIVAVVAVVLVVGGVGTCVVISGLGSTLSVETTADAGGTSATETTTEPATETGARSVTETPVAPATTTEPATQTPETGASDGGFDLNGFVGTWEFVGDPGPWGEGAPFSLERSGNVLVGTAGLPYYEETIRLELTAGNGELQGESTTTYPDGETEVMSLRMELDANGNLITVKYRCVNGEWLMRVAKRA